MSNEEKPRRWNLFASASKTTEAEKRFRRTEELRRDLFDAKSTDKAPRQAKQSLTPAEYALDTLLAMLWVEAETGRVAVACALADVPPQLGKSEAPAFAVRLCAHLHAAPTDPLAIPSLSLTSTVQSATRRQWAEKAVVAIFNDALIAISQLSEQTAYLKEEIITRETGVCRDALRLGIRLHSPALVETTLRLLRLFTPDSARDGNLIGRRTLELRALASQLLAGLSPDDLLLFWNALGKSDSVACNALLQVLDYLDDPRTVPHLLKLLERCPHVSNGELIGWACVRALQRFGDRRALPALRQLAATDKETSAKLHGLAKLHVPPLFPISPELARAARNAIAAIENGHISSERHFLLRPSQAGARDLLLPTSGSDQNRDADTNATELLRPDTNTPE